MPEFFRSIVGRLRKYARDRRSALRRRVRLPLSVSLLETSKMKSKRPVPGLEGHTLDLNANGLGFILPAIRIGEHYLAGEDRTLLIVLELPSGPVQMRATSVRYERLDENRNDDGYLIGARITHISDEHRKRFLSYLEGK